MYVLFIRDLQIVQLMFVFHVIYSYSEDMFCDKYGKSHTNATEYNSWRPKQGKLNFLLLNNLDVNGSGQFVIVFAEHYDIIFFYYIKGFKN